jgi:SNF2 family DNA or RNA helicase
LWYSIVVFSYFRDVLQMIYPVLGDIAVSPLTGSVPPADRQDLVEDFTSRPGRRCSSARSRPEVSD